MADNKQETGPLEKFLAKIRELKGREIVYRGQSDADWKVESTAYRRLKINNNQTPYELLKYSQERIAKVRPDALRAFGGPIFDLRIIAKLQHHGAATMFIDFTKSALTALWFACHERENEDKDGKVFCLDIGDTNRFSEIKHEDEKKDLSDILECLSGKIAKYEPPRDDRVLKQDSFFIFNAEGKLEDREFGKLIITIKQEDKGEILEQLKKSHNLSEETVFPDFYGFAQNNDFRKPYYMQTAEELHEVALSHHRQGNYEKAIALYGDVIERDPDFVPAYNNRGDAKAMLRRYEEAIADFDEAIKRDPDFVPAYNNRGNAKAMLERYGEAIADFDEALKRDSDFVRAYSNRGNAKFALGRYDDAIKDHDEALKRDSGFAIAYNNRGNAKLALRRYGDAIEDFDDAIRLAPNSAPTHSNRANAKAMLGRDDEALEDFDKVIQLAPDFAPAYFQRGNFKHSRGNYKEAIADYDTAISKKPDYAEAYRNRGLAKKALGLDDEAQKDFKKAHELDPERFKLDGDANPI